MFVSANGDMDHKGWLVYGRAASEYVSTDGVGEGWLESGVEMGGEGTPDHAMLKLMGSILFRSKPWYAMDCSCCCAWTYWGSCWEDADSDTTLASG